MNKVLSSPNMMVWQYFQALRRLCYAIEQHQDHDKETIQQDVALGVILAITGVEIFMNVYFRVLVDEAPYRHAAASGARICNPNSSSTENDSQNRNG